MRTLLTIAVAFALSGAARRAGAQDTYLLIVAGLGGEPEYAESFRSWSSALHSAAEKRMGVPRTNIVLSLIHI